MDVSVVLPTMNEEEAIQTVLPRIKAVLDRTGLRYEIIVVDRSTDKTPQIARELGAVVIRQRGRGYGDAYLEGFRAARGRFILMMDPDGSYDPEDIPALLEPLLKDEADLVMGNRLKGEMDEGAMPWLHRKIGNPLLTWILNFFFKAGISDAHCGMRAIRRDALEKLPLKCRGMEFASEMVIEAAKHGLRIKEVPIRYHRRIGESKLSSFRDGWRHLRLMLLYSPTYLFFLPGLFLLLLGLFLMGYTYFFEPIRLHTLILGSLLVISGTQILGFGVSAKVYAVKEGFERPDRITRFFMRYSILEEGLLLGGLMFLIGLALGLKLFLQWRATGYGALFHIREAVLILTLITLGLQVIFFSFFISVYMLKEG
ncbi:dolichol-P-glucose synthetase [Thermococcus profundus]|uniref:Dolichol-P-glucose synthetase n=1 Tax=Thermococcus profundus TaxID=49899 RepID=A0A2Z2MDK9_THEPR|nr:glycosyltransferase family 2 protein [Thermococcus profundus]ASJ03619.1 dolichol-P-glucose synthetase [Thermococcus profundus]